ncbi:MAG TPA: zinc-dependent alcohol dehydrogenase family protein [Candidatus Angelobacter sp.]
MKAQVLKSPSPVETHPLVYTDIPVPEPGEDEVLVKVNACGVCRTDLHVVEGELPPKLPSVIPGHQVVGTVAKMGKDAASRRIGERVGVAWLHRTDGSCEFCRRGEENLCEKAQFTGYSVNGGYAEYIIAPAKFIYPIPEGFGDIHAAPLLCAGIIGFRALRLANLKKGDTLGIYGFGAAGHVAIQVGRYWGMNVVVCTREERHRKLARELGAEWVGGAYDTPPMKMNAAIIFAPAGELVPAALAALKKAGTVVLGGIHMSPIPSFPYELLYHERVVRSVANNTRQDGMDFLKVAAEIPIHTETQIFPLQDANRALEALKHDAIRGQAVLEISS